MNANLKILKNSKINKCPITNSKKYFTYLDLGKIPLVNKLNNTKEESLNCEKFELKVNYFPSSRLSVLSQAIDPKILYSNYLYKSGTSQPYKEHCSEMEWFCNSYLNFKLGDKVLDIGGNDGTLLEVFKNKKEFLEVLNVDMSINLVKECNKKGIPAINAKWGLETSKNLNNKFKLITTTNCFQHTKDINDFVEGIKNSLSERGIWCLEFPYWKESLLTNQFDQVYHEHAYYYLIYPLYMLFAKYGLQIIKITPKNIHGGSLRLLVSNLGIYNPCGSVNEFIKSEKYVNSQYGSRIDETYLKNWSNKISNHIKESKEVLLDLKNKGFKIAGFGAAAKGCVYLNSANIDHTLIDYVIDDTDLKQNKFIPGTGIEILPRKILKKYPVDYILILAHNFSEYIINSLKDKYKGKFIILFPEIKII